MSGGLAIYDMDRTVTRHATYTPFLLHCAVRRAPWRLLFLPLVIPVVVGGVGATVVDDPGRYLGFLALYDLIFAILSWASFEYVVVE